MDRLQTEDGQLFLRSLANFVRQHEKALANSLQLHVSRSTKASTNTSTTSLASLSSSTPTAPTHTSSSIVAAFSFAGLNFKSHSIKPAHLTLTPHHLFYLLSRMEELDISIGSMNIRLENIHIDPSPSNYVSFLQSHKAPARGRSDNDSLHSVSSVRSVMSGMSAFWSSIGLGSSSSSKNEKMQAQIENDTKYLYSAFTKLPSLRLAPDHRARLIKGYEEFPFDTAVPLFAFKNLQQLDIIDVDFRSFFGWDRLADQLVLLTVKRANVDDPLDLLTNIVLDDVEKRRKRSTRGAQGSPTSSWTVPSTPKNEYTRSNSDSGSPPINASPSNLEEIDHIRPSHRQAPDLSGSVSPKRPAASRPASSYRHIRTYSKANRSGSGSSNSSEYNVMPHRSESSSSLLTVNTLSPSKWQRLKYLSLADNSLTFISAKSIMPLATSLRSLNLSSNLFAEIPDSLALLTRLTSLDLSNCMIDSLQSLSRNPLPAILTLKLRSNRLQSLAGIERLLSLENLNVQDNHLTDPMEPARLTGTPNIRRLWVEKNPFTRKFSDYRVTIWNVFRKTPGYLEDLVLDDCYPGFTERKYLVERVPEIERPPVARSIQIIEPSVVVQNTNQDSARNAGESGYTEREANTESITKVSTNSTRRRKGTRRRIVDLSRDENAVSTSIQIFQDDKKHSSDTIRPTYLAEMHAPSTGEILQTSVPTEVLGISESLQDLVLQTGAHPDEYRQKVEALRQEFGSNWISVLGERGYGGEHNLGTDAISPLQHSPLHRPNNHAIVSGGRTLG